MLWRAVCDDRSRPVPRQALPRAVDALGLGALSTWPTVAIYPARPDAGQCCLLASLGRTALRMVKLGASLASSAEGQKQAGATWGRQHEGARAPPSSRATPAPGAGVREPSWDAQRS